MNVVPSDLRGRADFPHLMAKRGVWHAVEIGTDRGGFARQLLSGAWKGQLWCIDPYLPYSGMGWGRETDLAMAIAILAPFTPHVRIVRSTAEQWLPHAGEFVDHIGFVYIDGNHEYEAVRNDIATWWPRLKPGAILAGHDFDSPTWPGVTKAVTELAESENLTVYTVADEDATSWYIEKPALPEIVEMDGPLPEGLVEDLARIAREDVDPPGLDVYPIVFSAPVAFPLQRARETAAMIAEARSIAPRVVVEIGADKGGGCYQWLKGLQPTVFVGIEIRGVPYEQVFREVFQNVDQLWLDRSSYDAETVEVVRDWLRGEKIDVLFIDGDKANFSADFDAYLPMVREGGIVMMHDVSDEAPGAAFQRAIGSPRVRSSMIIEDRSEVADVVAREKAGLPPANPHEGWLRHWRGASCTVGVLRV